jgi:ferric enterobactin receptor
MRLAVMVKYLLLKIRNSALSCITFFLLFSSFDLYSQNYKEDYRQVPLSEALVQASRHLGIKVAFDSEKLSSVNINAEVTGNTPEEFISSLLQNTGFSFKYKYNRFLIIRSDSLGTPDFIKEFQLLGSVSDRETGEHLPYATIIINARERLASASENGSFCIKNVCTNPVRMLVSYIGYDQLDTSVYLTGQSENIDIRMVRKTHILDSIVVKGRKLEMVSLRNDVEFATTVDPAKLIDLPVLAETDIFRMLQLLPGINYSENSSGLSIRGGSGDQNLVLFDGQTLYNLSHYYGVVSAINPNVIKDLQIYKGGYDSRFGERVSGIVDITGKSGSASKPVIYGDLNLLSANLTAEMPLGKKITLIGAMRRSYSDLYSTGFSDGLFERNANWFKGDSLTIINQTKPTFYYYDYNAKVTYRPGNMESFSIGFYGGKDFFKNSYTGTSQMLLIDAIDKNTWSNYGLSALWQKQWKESLYTSIQAGTSGYSNSSFNRTSIDRTGSPDPHDPFLPQPVDTFSTSNKNDLNDRYLSLKSNYIISERSQLNFGFISRINTIYYHKDAEQVYVYDNTTQSGWTTSVYLQDKTTLFDKLTFKPGMRLSYYNNTGKAYLEPRFSISYNFSDYLSARIATGRYYQFISQVMAQQETGYNKSFWVMADDSVHPEVRSDHFILGATFEKGRFMVDAEAYYKSYSGLQEYIFLPEYLKNSDFNHYFPKPEAPAPSDYRPSYYISGTGRSYGLDIMLKYSGKKYTGWLSYSYGRSIHRFKDINYGSDIPAPTDRPHQLSMTNMFTAGKWNFGTVTIYSSGKPYIDFTRSDNLQLPLLREYKRLPDYFRSDVSVNYNFNIRKAKFKTGLIFLNIFNTQNYFDINTRKFDFDNTTFSEATLVQSQSFSLNCFIHFLF